MNSLYQQLNQGPQVNTPSFPPQNNNSELFNLMNQYQSGQLTEQQAINKLLQMNPQMQNIMNLMQVGGKTINYKDMFYQFAKMKGIDPNIVLNQIQQQQRNFNNVT